MKRGSNWKTGLLLCWLTVCGWLVSAPFPATAQSQTSTQASPQASTQASTPAVTSSLGANTNAPTNSADYERLPFMQQSPAESSSEAPSAGGLLLRTFGALLLVLGLLVAAAWGLRRFGGGTLAGGSREDVDLSVLATLPLGERRSVSAVRFGDQLLLLGATAQTVTLLAKTTRPVPVTAAAQPRMRSVAELLAEDAPPHPVPPNFERALLLAKEQLAEASDEEFTEE